MQAATDDKKGVTGQALCIEIREVSVRLSRLNGRQHRSLKGEMKPDQPAQGCA